MSSRSRRVAGLALTGLALACWALLSPSAFAHGGGGGHGGGGHSGGGHSGGGHSGGGHSGGHAGGHYSGGGHHGGYEHHGGYYHHGGYPGYYGGLGGFGGFYPGYFGGYGYGYGYSPGGYGYGSYGGTYSYPYGYGAGTCVVDGTAPVYAPPATTNVAPAPGRYLGIQQQPVFDGAANAIQVVSVEPGSAAEQAGLRAGDVILSANGYLTQDVGNLPWIIAGTPANGELAMSVRSAADGQVRTVTARIP